MVSLIDKLTKSCALICILNFLLFYPVFVFPPLHPLLRILCTEHKKYSLCLPNLNNTLNCLNRRKVFVKGRKCFWMNPYCTHLSSFKHFAYGFSSKVMCKMSIISCCSFSNVLSVCLCKFSLLLQSVHLTPLLFLFSRIIRL